MDFGAFSAKNLASCDCETVFAFACYWPALGIPVWCLLDKKWWYGFKQYEELPVWHDIPYHPTSSTDLYIAT